MPTIAQASRTVGSPQIRARGTVGGNLGTGSPAGDALPVLAVHDADIELVAAGGRRRAVPWHEFLLGPKRTARAPDELILGARWRPIDGPGSFSKVGTRNAMVIAVASLCLALDPATRTVRVALGSVAPTVVRAPEAEGFAARALTDAGSWEDPAAVLADGALREFGELVAGAATPIDDVRGSAAYRRHALTVLARRALTWADERGGGGLMRVRARVNGEWREADVQAEASLLTMLRESLGLLGSKNACEQGECGSCSVWLDGEVVCACLVLAAQAEGREVRTVEGLATGDDLHPVQDGVRGRRGRSSAASARPGSWWR